MAKEIVTMSIDPELMQNIRQLKINVSGEVNDFLRNLVARHNDDVDGLNLRLERLEAEKALKKINHWQNIHKRHQANIDKIEEIQKQREQEQIKQEKETIENAKRCYECKETKAEAMKMHAFGSIQICNSCFMSRSGQKVKEWINIGNTTV